MSMTDAKSLAQQLGRKEMEAALGVGQTAISNAVVRDSFPASWFVVLNDMAKAKGIDCPPQLFSRMRLPKGHQLTSKAS